MPEIFPQRVELVFQRLIFLIAVMFASSAYALGLGEIHVSSNLGEPLKAQIALLSLADSDAQDVKVSLAHIEEYRKLGLQYPEGLKFRFQVVNEQGANPVIHIATQHPVDELFLDVVLEVITPSGRFARAYAILIDPPTGMIDAPVVTQPESGYPQAGTGTAKAADEAIVPVPVQNKMPAAGGKPIQTVTKRSKRVLEKTSQTIRGTPPIVESTAVNEAAPKVKLFGKLSMTLSSSLAISRSDPTQQGGAASANDALQEELIAKEKTLNELNLQIAEMQDLIKELHLKMGTQTGSAVVSAETVAQSAVAENVPEQTTSSGAGPIGHKPAAAVNVVSASRENGREAAPFFEQYRQIFIAGTVLLLLVAAGIFWYRRRKRESQWSFASSANDQGSVETAVKETSGNVVDVTRKMGEQTLKAPAYQTQKIESTSHPEYDFLEEADIYLRFGHDNLAEEVLLEAIKLNPANPHGYLTLLGIYETRVDAKAFNNLAQQFRTVADDNSWMRAAEMGRKLDSENPLYVLAEQVSVKDVTERGYKSELDEMAKLVGHEDDPFQFDPLRKG